MRQADKRQLVEDFIAAWGAMDDDSRIGFLTRDIVYHNIPLLPLRGLVVVDHDLKTAWRFIECDWPIINIAVSGDINQGRSFAAPPFTGIAGTAIPVNGGAAQAL